MPPAATRAGVLLVAAAGEGDALAAHLAGEGHVVIRGGGGREARLLARVRPPALVVLDLDLTGLDAVAAFARPATSERAAPILALSRRPSPEGVARALRTGADDHLAIPCHPAELLARVHALLRRAGGDPPIPHRPSSDAELAGHFGLTPRQLAILRLVAQGLTNGEIAERLRISRYTARNHVAAVLAKLQVASRGRVASALFLERPPERPALLQRLTG